MLNEIVIIRKSGNIFQFPVLKFNVSVCVCKREKEKERERPKQRERQKIISYLPINSIGIQAGSLTLRLKQKKIKRFSHTNLTYINTEKLLPPNPDANTKHKSSEVVLYPPKTLENPCSSQSFSCVSFCEAISALYQ